jgi:hypothetical protein
VRTGLYIPQRAIVENDLLGNVTTDALLLLDYLRRWVTCKNVKRVRVRERDFFWIKYAQACRDLPILFPRRPILRTQINKIVQLVASLKKNGLIDTVRVRSRCYVHLTEMAHALYPTPDPDSRMDRQAIMSTNDSPDMEKYDSPVMRSRDSKSELYKEEKYEAEPPYTQNTYSNEQLESVKRRLEAIFPKRQWSNTEINLLRRQMPIPECEMKLILRFYELPGPPQFFPADKLSVHDFALARRRQTMKTLLEYWSNETTRAFFFFKTPQGVAEAQRHGWDLSEMRWDANS